MNRELPVAQIENAPFARSLDRLGDEQNASEFGVFKRAPSEVEEFRLGQQAVTV